MESSLKIFKKINWFLLLRLIGIVIFIFVLINVDIQSIWLNIKQVHPRYFLLAVVLQFILLFIKGFRWHILNETSKKRTNIYKSLGEFFESYAIGVITPGRMGELLKAGHQREKKDMISSGIRVVTERGLDVGFFLIVAGSAIVWGNLIDINNSIGIIPLSLGLIVALISVLLISSKKLMDWFANRPQSKSIQLTKKSQVEIIWIIVLSLLSNLLYFISCFFLAVGIKLNMTILIASGGIAISGLINMMPVTVMGLGTRELTFLYVFNDYSEMSVLAFSGLVFIVAQIGGGLISLILGQGFLYLSKRL